MKKISGILIFAALLFCALSCSDGLLPDVPSAQEVAGEGCRRVSFQVAFGEESKASLGDDRSVVWELGDEVAVYDITGNKPRKFTVTSLTPGGAVISGEILENSTRVWAVRPYSAAAFCLLEDKLRVCLPEVQTIPEGGTVDPAALVSVATAAPGGTLSFRNAVSLLKFEVSRTDVSSVVIAGTRREKLGGTACVLAGSGEWEKAVTEADVRVAPESGCFAPGTYYATVFPADLQYGLGAHCYAGDVPVCSKITGLPNTFGRNGSYALGDVSDISGMTPTVYAQGEITNLTSYLKSAGYNISALSLLISLYIPNNARNVYYYDYTYPSSDALGNPTVLSARLFVYGPAVTSKSTLSGITLVSHATESQASAAPTRSGKTLEAVVAWSSNGYAVVCPDNCGMGVNEFLPQLYLDADGLARSNLDALAAAKTILAAKGIKYAGKLCNFGYSQGGYGAIATLRYASMHPEEGVSFSKTMAGAGPYDVNLFYDTVRDDSYPNAVAFVPVALVSAVECGHLPVEYANVFSEPLRSHVDDWVLSKEYSVNRIKSLTGVSRLDEMLLPAFISGTGPEFEAVSAYFTENDLTSGWTPASGSDVFLYTSSQDDMVPSACSDDLYGFLQTFSKSGRIDLKYTSSADGSHSDGALQFALKSIGYF